MKPKLAAKAGGVGRQDKRISRWENAFGDYAYTAVADDSRHCKATAPRAVDAGAMRLKFGRLYVYFFRRNALA